MLHGLRILFSHRSHAYLLSFEGTVES
jgi:hypothetical protein